MTTPTLLTTKEVAALLRVHSKQVYRLMKRGLPALRVGDEWRFRRKDVVQWATDRKPTTGGAEDRKSPGRRGSSADSSDGLIAANGDWAVEVLLTHLRNRERLLLGLVLSDHARGQSLLDRGRVLAAGGHAKIEAPEDHEPGRRSGKTVRLQLVTRDVGLAMQTRPLRHLSGIVGKRLATRPATAGLRAILDEALSVAGIDLSATRTTAIEFGCHRDVTLAVAQGKADVGLTTRAWAHAVGLNFFPLAREDYELRFAADQMGDPRILAICEVVQSGRFRRELRAHPGYGVARTGQIRVR